MSHRHLALAGALVVTAIAFGGCDKDKSSGSAQKTTGKLEEAAGDLTGNSKLKSEGRTDKVVGGVKSTVGDIKDTVHDATKSKDN